MGSLEIESLEEVLKTQKFRLRGNWMSREVWFNEELLNPKESQKLRNHSPDGFNWSYTGSGPAQLALAVCLKLYPQEKALRLYQEFKCLYIATLPPGNFDIELEV